VSVQQNTDMRKITAWAAIIAVPTMGVGVYGVNFDFMPELHWKFGYPLVMTVILLACLISTGCSNATNGWDRPHRTVQHLRTAGMCRCRS
jgi:Mg2+ and Co2+ transporter CorA